MMEELQSLVSESVSGITGDHGRPGNNAASCNSVEDTMCRIEAPMIRIRMNERVANNQMEIKTAFDNMGLNEMDMPGIGGSREDGDVDVRIRQNGSRHVEEEIKDLVGAAELGEGSEDGAPSGDVGLWEGVEEEKRLVGGGTDRREANEKGAQFIGRGGGQVLNVMEEKALTCAHISSRYAGFHQCLHILPSAHALSIDHNIFRIQPTIAYGGESSNNSMGVF